MSSPQEPQPYEPQSQGPASPAALSPEAGDIALRIRVGEGPGGGEQDAAEHLRDWLGGTEELQPHASVSVVEVPVPLSERPPALGSADFVYDVLVNVAAAGGSAALMVVYRLLRSHLPLRGDQVVLVVEFPDGSSAELRSAQATQEEMRDFVRTALRGREQDRRSAGGGPGTPESAPARPDAPDAPDGLARPAGPSRPAGPAGLSRSVRPSGRAADPDTPDLPDVPEGETPPGT